jgi:hypothetical protein
MADISVDHRHSESRRTRATCPIYEEGIALSSGCHTGRHGRARRTAR